MGALMLALAAAFVGLGVWQVQRRTWKLGLIAMVDARVHAPPVPAPGPAAWPGFPPEANQYLHVQVSGTLLNDRETSVQALTELGAGDWVVTPLRTDEGWIVLVNRGFVPSGRRNPASRSGGELSGHVTVTGLLRPSEPDGGFLRHNDPGADRWFSRDVAAIARVRGLGAVAPYFIDADAAPNPGGFPVGGLTVISFPNNHLIYAITWFSLAALSFGGLWNLRPKRRDTAL